MQKFITAAVLAFSVFVLPASASVVKFNEQPAVNQVAVGFADGTFSRDLNDRYHDGFHALSATEALNYYGQTDEFILFNSAKTLNSLTLANYSGLNGVTVKLYSASNQLLTQQTVNFVGYDRTLLTFDTANVTKVLFSNIGGYNAYGDGRIAGWYRLADVTYSANADLPEPASLALLGLGFAGLAAARRRVK